ncbi:porin [Nostoc sp. NIES-2111]
MKLMKSLLLGTAAGFAAVAGDQAADLPVRKAAPVEYVRICSLGGGVFVGYVVPGTDVCLRVGGFARWQYTAGSSYNTLFNVGSGVYGPRTFVGGATQSGAYGVRGYGQRFAGQYAVGAVQLDARTQTEYGLLRSFADIRADAGFGGGGAFIDKAWVQLGGFQAGKYQSYFDFYADAFNNIGTLGSDHSVVGAACTAIFGNFSAAISFEDLNTNWGSPGYFGLGSVLDPAGVPVGGFGYGSAFANTTAGGYRVPDVVARLLYADSWGQVQLTGALHQLRASSTVWDVNDLGGGNTVVTTTGEINDDTKYGWAVQGGLKLNVPSFGPGDALYLQAAYTQGALTYVGAGGTYGFGKVTQIAYGADGLPNNSGSIELTTGWNALAAFQHTFTPTLSAALWGSYTAIDYGSDVFNGTGTINGAGLTGRDFNYWQVGAQANWSPVKNFTVSGTVNYVALEASRLAIDSELEVPFKKTSNGVAFAVRVQRDF